VFSGALSQEFRFLDFLDFWLKLMYSTRLMSIQKIHEVEENIFRNDKGHVKGITFELTNAEDEEEGLNFNTINQYYQNFMEEYGHAPERIILTGIAEDGGMKTIKAQGWTEKNLKWVDEDYYSSLPKDQRRIMQGSFYKVYVNVLLSQSSWKEYLATQKNKKNK
jgi:hypothetical protein